MEYLINLLGINNHDFNQCNLLDGDGNGIIIGDYILTLSHIIEDNKYIYHNNIRYDILLNIKFYDICVLCVLPTNKIIDRKKEISNFIILLETYIDNNCIKIINHMNHINIDFKLFGKNITLILQMLEDTYLTGFIYPPLPLYKLSFNNPYGEDNIDINAICESGISGSIVYNKDGCLGLIVSQKLSTNTIEIMPLEIILDICKKYIMNELFNYIPLVINNNVIKHTYKKIYKNDFIKTINNNVLENNKILVKKYNYYMNYQTFILLYCNDEIDIELIHNGKYRYEKRITLDLLEYDFKKITINYEPNDNFIKFYDFEFKELSESFLLNNIDKNIPDIDYDGIYKNKKMLYISNITNINGRLNLEKNIYILNKISGHKIFNLNDIRKYLNNKKITLELIDPNKKSIKIKI
jgi:hypothetical protein